MLMLALIYLPFIQYSTEFFKLDAPSSTLADKYFDVSAIMISNNRHINIIVVAYLCISQQQKNLPFLVENILSLLHFHQ